MFNKMKKNLKIKIGNYGNCNTYNVNSPTTINQIIVEDVQRSKLIKDKKNGAVYKVVKRFIEVYENHSIMQNQIPFFIDKKFGLSLKDFVDYDSILKILNDDIINWTCEKFGVRREWLDGIDNQIYWYKSYYKEVHSFIRDTYNLVSTREQITMYVFKYGDLRLEEDGDHNIVFLLRYPIGKINSRYVYKYIPISTIWRWSYWRSRYQAKAIIYLCNDMGINVKGYDLIEKEKIASGEVFPEKLIGEMPLGLTWYPEDYIDMWSQNDLAREIEETNKVKKYMEKEGYIECLEKLKENNKMFL
ncbi:TPA: hypothetical protein ROY30_004123 [Bacillus cereus]|nr:MULTISPECIES: hypothetical protein [Bacillus]HCX47546.1 hypothetical protein [Bacillus sp. (in: firmicutes)]KMQ23692.1 hypothetical protein TU58_25360 [Bacillus cereus]MCP1177863.1 hypothetical protein [Bacillus sp. 1663tsa1]MCP1283028.1 hypothetical protein [Bacillus sp. S0635]MCQ6347678.1 hypothetical protein [Bacillus cereus]